MPGSSHQPAAIDALAPGIIGIGRSIHSGAREKNFTGRPTGRFHTLIYWRDGGLTIRHYTGWGIHPCIALFNLERSIKYEKDVQHIDLQTFVIQLRFLGSMHLPKERR